MRKQAVNDYPFMFEFIPNWHKTQEMCDAYSMILR